ncbi:prepilin peptidase [Mycolicibacterium madagascariense]|uniref:Prepilin peptidase n=1 Tax=Mycolicibacterium madagascariense TaxID=212765 RepID=A0A7I7XGB1_9MYCO|nr:A24 family peptidase [Mycolicibacterium madagascariense]MCV7013779.1 prepilin peptidase [Mycolicibacterium madagascariense]BBZ28244.1 prepilin peptidase [Mycolicibacterium madagascariense]
MAAALACALCWLAALTVFDVRHRRLPNALTLPGALAVLIIAASVGRGGEALLGALALTAAYLVVHLAAPTAMGAGDVKLALGVGGLTGAFGVEVWLLAAVAAPLLTALWGIATCRWRGPVAHGPSMCAATVAAVALAVAAP